MSHFSIEQCRNGEFTFLRALPARKTKKPPLLFVHGACTGSWCFEEFLRFFAGKGYPSYALDLPGHWRSGVLADLGRTSILTYVTHVHAFLDHVVGPHAVIAGHSMGGLIALKLLERYPAVAMVLITPAPPSGVRYQPGAALDVSWSAALAALFEVIQGKSILPSRAIVASMFQRLQHEPAKIDALYAKFGPESGKAGEEVLFGWIEVDPKKINVPRMVIGAGKDNIIHPDVASAVAQFFGVEVTSFPHHGHMLILEPGWEEVAGALSIWLSNNV